MAQAILSDLTPPSLATAVKANLLAFFQQFRRSSLATVQASGESFRWHTPVVHPWFNGILSTTPPGERAAELVQQTIAYFRSRAVGLFSWWLAPDLEVSPWRAHLLSAGFRYDDRTPGMAIDLAALPALRSGTLTVQQVEDLPTLAEWVSTFVRGYGIPEAMGRPFLSLLESLGAGLPLRHYLGFREGRPVATSTLFVGAGSAGIYNVSTIPEMRGQGIGSAMTLAPLHAARDLGYRVGVLQSSALGYSVYERLGFRKVCQIEHFYWSSHGS